MFLLVVGRKIFSFAGLSTKTTTHQNPQTAIFIQQKQLIHKTTPLIKTINYLNLN
jgi:hypothetical protein